MESIFESLNKFCKLLPHIKQAFGSSLYIIEEDILLEPMAVKTKNAELRIIQQCAEYTDTEHMD